MAIPIRVACPVNVWTKVATAVQSGNVWILKPNAVYHQTYVATGAAAPTGMTNACPMPEPGLPISVDVSSDVYIYAGGYAGEVAVAL